MNIKKPGLISDVGAFYLGACSNRFLFSTKRSGWVRHGSAQSCRAHWTKLNDKYSFFQNSKRTHPYDHLYLPIMPINNSFPFELFAHWFWKITNPTMCSTLTIYSCHLSIKNCDNNFFGCFFPFHSLKWTNKSDSKIDRSIEFVWNQMRWPDVCKCNECEDAFSI